MKLFSFIVFAGLSLMALGGCVPNSPFGNVDNGVTELVTTTGITSTLTGMMSTDPNMTLSGVFVYDYPPVGDIDQSRVGKQRQQGEQRLYSNDKKWEGIYYDERDWIYVGAMGVQAADVFFGYNSGYLYMDKYMSVIQFPVDMQTFISYYPQLENPNYTGTGDMEVHDKRSLYPICKDGYTMTLEEVVYDRERYEALIQKNPLRCFGEDQIYIYGRREHRPSDERGYELMRVRK